jgi:phage/conjugal plasmid C-4 type zinc finger TraR family protein
MDAADRAQAVIDQRLEEALALTRATEQSRAMQGPAECVDCGEEIPAARRMNLPGVVTCVPCQGIREQRARGWR